MYEVRALIDDYRKPFINFTDACYHADDMVRDTGQAHQVFELKLMYMSTPSKLISKAHDDYKKAARDK